MTISREKLTELQTDFYTGPDCQDLIIESKDPFWNWFMENANPYDLCEEFKEMFIEEDIIPGNCYGNSTKLAHREGLDYCEGFTKVKGINIFHSFNLFDNCVIDCTVQNNQQTFADTNGEIPREYYGVVIPDEFLPTQSTDSQSRDYLNLSPLIYSYYLHTIP